MNFEETLIQASEKVGRQLAYKYPGTEADDLTQAIRVKVLENKAKLVGESPEGIERALRWYGNIEGMRQFDGYLRDSGNWVYTRETVSRVLRVVFKEDAVWDLMPMKERDRGARVEAGGLAVFLMDLKEGYRNRLSDHERDMIELHYVHGVKHKEMGPADSRAVYRGIDKLAAHLNKGLYFRAQNHEGIGSRSNHTVKAAKARVEHSYDPGDRYEDATGYRFCGGNGA
ncbi:hypothetical protein [Streptomyces sp. NPDC059708]|uniref:hypothetical protein n=1 Tax=Streptomyces sp. NPDC059708 TaxID=3346916 RepID=UPI0036C11A55